jgi:hypothetical protein
MNEKDDPQRSEHDQDYVERLHDFLDDAVVKGAESLLNPSPPPAREQPRPRPEMPPPQTLRPTPPPTPPQPSPPPARGRIVPAVIGALIMLLAVAVAAIVALALRDTDTGTASTQDKPPPTNVPRTTQGSVPQTTPPVSSAVPTTTRPTPAFAAAERAELKLTAPALGLSGWLDLDVPRSFMAASYEDDKVKGADLQLNDDGELSTLHTTEYAKVGWGPAGELTPEQCVVAADRQPLGEHESPEVGRNICVVTRDSAVAWVRITDFAEPTVLGHRSVMVTATVWRKS